MRSIRKNAKLLTLLPFLILSTAAFSAGNGIQFEPCTILSAEVSSERKGFEKKYAVDNRAETKWIAAKAHCEGEWFFVEFSRAERVTAVEISTGGTVAGRKLRAGRIRKGTIELSSGLRTPFELSDIPAPQRILVAETPARWVKVVVSEIFPGAEIPEPSISEISVLKVVPVYSL